MGFHYSRLPWNNWNGFCSNVMGTKLLIRHLSMLWVSIIIKYDLGSEIQKSLNVNNNCAAFGIRVIIVSFPGVVRSKDSTRTAKILRDVT